MREYVLIFVVALAVTYLLAVMARELAMKFGAYARVRDRDVHEIPIPYFGGVAMMAGLGAAYLVATQLPFLSNSPSRDVIFHDTRAIVLGGCVMCLVGVIDDIFELDAITKLAGEVLAAGIVAVQGIQLYRLPLPGDESLSMFTLGGSQAALITVILIVATVNAVNFIDGLDGLAAGVVGIGAVAFFTFSVLLVIVNEAERATTAALLTAALAGACFGFLPHNFFPARMFMGDSGCAADRLHAGLLGDQPHRPVLDDHARARAARRRRQPAAGAAAADPAVRRAHRAVRRHGAGRRTPHPSRSVARSRPTRSTCTTGCSRSGTRSAARSS